MYLATSVNNTADTSVFARHNWSKDGLYELTSGSLRTFIETLMPPRRRAVTLVTGHGALGSQKRLYCSPVGVTTTVGIVELASPTRTRKQ